MAKVEIDYENKSDKELVELSRHPLYGENYKAELLRRNTEALKDSKEAADRTSRIIIDLTLVLFVVAFVQLLFSIFSSNIEIYLKWTISIGVLVLFAGIFRDMKKEYGNK